MEPTTAAPAPPTSASTNGGAPALGPRSYDAIVVGGGHNGLTTTAYLARAGLRVICLERREILGGACVTEELWPGARVSRCSYVVSMLQPKIVADLELERHGYRAIPLDPAYVSLTDEGPIFFFNEVSETAASIARYSKHDAENYPKFEALMDRAARFVKPMMLREPPAPGSKAPGDLAALLREAGRMAGFSKRDIHELVRVFTMSVGDLLDDYFELDGLKGSTASSGVVGVWAGPRTPGTAYNLLHHALGECGGIEGAWGQVLGGMGAISSAIADSARAAGAEILTGAEVASIDVRNGSAVGVTLADGTELRAPIVASGAHPKTTVLELTGAENFPGEIAEDMSRYRTRGASVKVNLLLSEPPVYEGVSDEEQQLMRTAGVNICPSIDYLERAWQDATLGPSGRASLRRGRAALGGRLEPHRRRPLGDDDVHPVRTAERGGLEARRPRALRRHVRRAADPVRAQPQGLRPRARGARAAGPRADLRAPGRLDLPGRAGPRPDGLHAPAPRDGPVRDPGRRPVSVRRRHPPRRRRHRLLGPQRRAPDPQGPPARAAQVLAPRADRRASRPRSSVAGGELGERLRELVYLGDRVVVQEAEPQGAVGQQPERPHRPDRVVVAVPGEHAALAERLRRGARASSDRT